MEETRIFISHNSDWKLIDDFADLIRVLEYYPVVVEKEASYGKDPYDKSKYYMNSSEMVIFVITKDAIDPSGRPHPKSNVAIEIGLAEEKFESQKKIFFVEEGAQTPTMVTKTYIPVKGGNYYKAIAQLINNIKSVLPHKQNEEVPYKMELDEPEKFIVLEMAKDTHGALPRPLLLKLLTEKFSLDERKFNIIRSVLRKKRIIREGEIAIGHDYSGDLYLELTHLGWELASELERIR